MKVDFHIHSTNSDGELSPNELLQYINKKGVKIASITDHNMVTHVNSNENQCRMIQGVEVTTYIGEKVIHILGYNFTENFELKNMLSYISKIFRNLPLKILHELRKKGFNIDLSNSARSHDLIRNIAEKLVSENYAGSVEEAYHAYINNEYNQILLQSLPSADTVIKILNSAQGISVLAHPTQYWTEIDSTISCISQLISYGLNGIECYHPSLCNEDIEKLISYAERHDLLISCGSDYHRQGHYGWDCGVEIEDKYIQRLLDIFKIIQ